MAKLQLCGINFIIRNIKSVLGLFLSTRQSEYTEKNNLLNITMLDLDEKTSLLLSLDPNIST